MKEKRTKIYKYENIEIEVSETAKILDFNGKYIIEIGDDFLPTGNGMEGEGHPIRVKKEDLTIVK